MEQESPEFTSEFIDDENNKRFLKVYYVDGTQPSQYHCIIDEDFEVAVMMGDDTKWIDVERQQSTSLSEIIGEIIEDQTA